MAFYDKLVQKIFNPIIQPFLKNIEEKDKIIKVQQEKLELLEKSVGNNVPIHFGTPWGTEYKTSAQDLYKWKKVVDFNVLRAFSERYDVARACINRRKRQVEGVDWEIMPKNPTEDPRKYEADIKRLKEFFDMPSGKYSRFRDFVAKIVEDLLVLDAAAIWKDKENGELKRLIVVDAATIKLRVYPDGSTPEPPDIAYEQWIQGIKVAEFTTNEMAYLMLNPRSNSPYGLSPLEALILGVDAALKSQLYNLSILTEGNIPEGFFTLPESWTPDQIREFQQYFDSLVAGNFKYQSRIKFMPGGKGVGYIPLKKPEDMRFLEYEKWLLLKTCSLFDVPPEEIGFTEEMSRATAQVQTEIATKVGLKPILLRLKEFFDDIIQIDFGCPHLHFVWYGLDKKEELRDAQIVERLAPLGFISVDEWRIENGLPPIGLKHYIMAGGQPILVEDLLNSRNNQQKEETKEIDTEELEEQQETNSEKIIEELRKWEKKCINSLKKGKKFKPFYAKYIPEDVKKLIEVQLLFAKTKEDVKKIFRKQIELERQNYIIEKAVQLKRDIENVLSNREDN